MESRRLRHFLAVADHGGFTAAAQAVYVSQPALSVAVKELEAELGAALFTRNGRTVRLTAAGGLCWSRPDRCCAIWKPGRPRWLPSPV